MSEDWGPVGRDGSAVTKIRPSSMICISLPGLKSDDVKPLTRISNALSVKTQNGPNQKRWALQWSSPFQGGGAINGQHHAAPWTLLSCIFQIL